MSASPESPSAPTAAASAPPKRAPTDHIIATNVRKCPTTNVDISLAYITLGDPSHEALLVVPGLNANFEMYHPEFLHDLSKAGPFFVIVVENRDTGHSTKLDELGSPATIRFFLPRKISGLKAAYPLHELADDAIAVVDQLGIERTHVLGASMGGMIAQLVAIRHPHRVLTLTSLVSTTGSPDLPDPPMKTKLGFLRKPKDDSEGAAIENKYGWMLDFGLSDVNKDRPGNKEYMKVMSERMIKRSTYQDGLFRQTAAVVMTPSREEDLAKLTCPVLVIHGDKDVVVLPEHGERTAKCIPHCKYVVVPGMGHVPDIDGAALICAEVASMAAKARETAVPESTAA